MTSRTRNGRTRIGAVVGSGALFGAALVGAASSAAVAGATQTGCPMGFETLSVATLTGLGYGEDFLAMVDENADGVVCGKPFSTKRQENFCESRPGGCTVDVIYGFRDNDAAHH